MQTVSGIRGQLKRVVKEGHEGSFRATFEDKILMSDLVFCKTWYSIDIPRICNPVVAYGAMRMIKSHRELRNERDLAIPHKNDSMYARHDEVLDRERDERVFAPLKVPESIARKVPFASKQRVLTVNEPAEIEKRRKTNLLESLNLPTTRPFKKLFMNKEEKEIHTMVQRLSYIDKVSTKEREVKLKAAQEETRKRDQKVQDKRDAMTKSLKKRRYQKE